MKINPLSLAFPAFAVTSLIAADPALAEVCDKAVGVGEGWRPEHGPISLFQEFLPLFAIFSALAFIVITGAYLLRRTPFALFFVVGLGGLWIACATAVLVEKETDFVTKAAIQEGCYSARPVILGVPADFLVWGAFMAFCAVVFIGAALAPKVVRAARGMNLGQA